jgi:DNA-binding XRE family transcriptional regulator
MNYAEAAKIRKTGLGELITNRIIEGKNASITRAISDKFAARSVGFKETFGLMNLAKVLTGGSNLAAAFMGRMTGAKPEDILHVTGRKQAYGRRLSDSYGMNQGSSTMSNEVLEKMLNFMQQTQVKEEERLETLMSYEEFQSKLREDHHREVMEVLLKATLNKRKAEKQMKAETKKREQLAISKTHLAGLVGVTEPTITRIEKGDDCYRLCTFIKCCDVLKINVKVDGIQQALQHYRYHYC